MLALGLTLLTLTEHRAMFLYYQDDMGAREHHYKTTCEKHLNSNHRVNSTDNGC